MSNTYDYDLIVVGAGPGGYVSAILASQYGLRTAVVEQDKAGGVCLNVGCIPSKSLIHQAEQFRTVHALEGMGLTVDRGGLDYGRVLARSREAAETLRTGVLHLLGKNGVELVRGKGRVAGAHEVAVESGGRLSGKHVLLATGSRPLEFPGLPFDEERVLSSTGALMLRELPSKAAIIGSGYIGMELAHVWNAFGVDVHVVELLDAVLPVEDREAAAVVRRQFESRGVRFYTGTRASGADVHAEGARLALVRTEGEEITLDADLVLVAVGRRANSEDLGLEQAGVGVDARGFIEVGDFYRTDCPSVYAVGDVVGPPQLAHAASREGEAAVRHMCGHETEARLDPDRIPCAIYCEPQLARFGYTEERAREEGVEYSKAVFPYRGCGKAVAIGRPEGMVKVLYEPDTGDMIGAHVVGAEATELIHELLLAKTAELLPEDIAAMVHAHPTFSESLAEVARGMLGSPVHV